MGCNTLYRMTAALNSHPCRAPWHRVLGDVAEGAGVVAAKPARPGECVVQVVMSQMPCLICSCPVSFLVKSDERPGHAQQLQSRVRSRFYHPFILSSMPHTCACYRYRYPTRGGRNE